MVRVLEMSQTQASSLSHATSPSIRTNPNPRHQTMMADQNRARELPAPRTLGYSKEDVLSNLAFFFGDPAVPERLRDYSEHHAMWAPGVEPRELCPRPCLPLADLACSLPAGPSTSPMR